jgi:peptidoglycan/xylan/chitin deacetylase (PgdA/CDA1 family)
MGTLRRRWRPEAVHDLWLRQATAAAIGSARKIIGSSAVPARTPIAALSDEQLGWLICAGIASWISTRAAQASDEGSAAIEETIRLTGAAPEPWDSGAIETVLPELGAIEGIDWNVPVFDWPKATMLLFLCTAFELISDAIAARDQGGDNLTTPSVRLDDLLPW